MFWLHLQLDDSTDVSEILSVHEYKAVHHPKCPIERVLKSPIRMYKNLSHDKTGGIKQSFENCPVTQKVYMHHSPPQQENA
jgi:hypothetical protein